MPEKQVKEMLQWCKEEFLKKEKGLLDVNVNERSLTSKFAQYMQIYLQDKYDVDCEYNRSGSDQKFIFNLQDLVGKNVSTDSIEAQTIYPDIIVHRRGINGPNIIIIEAKKNPTRNAKRKDVEKIRKIKSQFKYEWGVFLWFDTTKTDIDWDFV